LDKNAIILRTLLELPLAPELDAVTVDGQTVSVTGLRQRLEPDTAEVIGKWKDGSAAVTVRRHGKGRVYAVGALPGTAWMKTAVRPLPWARGGRHTVYTPVDFAPAAARLVRLGVDAARPVQAAVCSVAGVEAVVMDHQDGTLVTLVNWTNAPIK